MQYSTRATRHGFAKWLHLAPRLVPRLALLAATLLAGCETAGSGLTSEAGKPGEPPKVEAGKPAEPPKIEPPMTRSRAATECWIKTEKGSAGVNIDKRADTVTKCIDDKIKAAAAPKT